MKENTMVKIVNPKLARKVKNEHNKHEAQKKCWI